MRRWSKTLTCRRCGKRFKETFGDAIMPKDQQLLQCPLCRRCRVLMRTRLVPKSIVPSGRK